MQVMFFKGADDAKQEISLLVSFLHLFCMSPVCVYYADKISLMKERCQTFVGIQISQIMCMARTQPLEPPPAASQSVLAGSCHAEQNWDLWGMNIPKWQLDFCAKWVDSTFQLSKYFLPFSISDISHHFPFQVISSKSDHTLVQAVLCSLSLWCQSPSSCCLRAHSQNWPLLSIAHETALVLGSDIFIY